jgi:hypothetical protein
MKTVKWLNLSKKLSKTKKMIVTVLVATTVVLSATSCEKIDYCSAKKSTKKTNSDCDLIPAKIIRYDCDKVIFQLLTSQTIGDANWKDEVTGINYTNVVSYYNTCEIGGIAQGELTTLYVNPVKLNENKYNAACIQCLAISTNVPETKIDFLVVSKETCGNNESSN